MGSLVTEKKNKMVMKRGREIMMSQKERERGVRKRFTTGRRRRLMKLKNRMIVSALTITESKERAIEKKRRARIQSWISSTKSLKAYCRAGQEERKQEPNQGVLMTGVSSNRLAKRDGVTLMTRAKRFQEITESIWE